jgi:hypothetical protein
MHGLRQPRAQRRLCCACLFQAFPPPLLCFQQRTFFTVLIQLPFCRKALASSSSAPILVNTPMAPSMSYTEGALRHTAWRPKKANNPGFCKHTGFS